MVDPAIIAGAVTAVGIAVAAGYSYLTGNESSVDTDDDGEEDITFGGNSRTELPETDGNEEPSEDLSGVTFEAAPEDVRNIDSLDDVKGIGPTRADDLRKNGFHTASDLYFASDEELEAVNGIGSLTVSQIRDDIGSIEDEAAEDEEGNPESSEE